MPKFKCVNPECLFFEQIKEEGKATYRMMEGRLIAREAFCPSCNQERHEVTVNEIFEKPTYEAVGMNSNRRNWSRSTREGSTHY